MKNFSKNWKSSKNPKKQRKFLAKAPAHIRKRFLSVTLSKDLRQKYQKRNIPLRKGDTVKILKGKFKRNQGKVITVNRKTGKIFVEGVQTKKNDGSKVNVPMKTPNLEIIELYLDDKKRKLKYEKKESNKKEVSEEIEVRKTKTSSGKNKTKENKEGK